jgi:RNA polymerase sigma factor (sigma-70 family)
MGADEFLAERFEEHRGHLRAVAYRMLGSLAEAEDVVQEAWLRLHRTDTAEVANLGGWLTTVVGRICLNVLRSRRTHPEEPLDARMPEPVISRPDGVDPEQAALLADSVGLALLVVLDTLAPAERLAFVLHDMFAVPFEEIAPVVERTPAATRQLASRARRRVQDSAPGPDPDLARQRAAVDAFFAATRTGDFEALVAVLDPDIVLRSDDGSGKLLSLRGAQSVAGQALMFTRMAPFVRPALINGVAGVVVAPQGRVFSIMAFTVVDDRIVAIDAITAPDLLATVDPALLD